ncbi:unnamed protein product, partial [Musa hybrid cultivar]
PPLHSSSPSCTGGTSHPPEAAASSRGRGPPSFASRSLRFWLSPAPCCLLLLPAKDCGASRPRSEHPKHHPTPARTC